MVVAPHWSTEKVAKNIVIEGFSQILKTWQNGYSQFKVSSNTLKIIGLYASMREYNKINKNIFKSAYRGRHEKEKNNISRKEIIRS